jgi:hypothetical protein
MTDRQQTLVICCPILLTVGQIKKYILTRCPELSIGSLTHGQLCNSSSQYIDIVTAVHVQSFLLLFLSQILL